MKIHNFSGKSRASYHWYSGLAASLLAVALAGCGGGGGDAAPAAAPVGGGSSAATGATVGTAVLTAAAAAPATTNTAANPAQAFGLIAAVGAAPVTVQSPPVVNFTVIDSTGKFVSGLTLANTAVTSAAATAAEPNCSGNNVTFEMAKLNQPIDSSPSTWQSLISRQRLAAGTALAATTANKSRFVVAAGNADPKPTNTATTITKSDASTSSGQIVNADDAAAIADPTKRIVGILKENTAGGYYTYYFATDVVTPLKFSDMVADPAFATKYDATALSQGLVGNNGNVAVKDGKTVHRIGAQLCYVDPATKAKVLVNPTMDFTLNADGTANLVKASDGTLTEAKKVVNVASCNQCHEKLAAHGTRVDTNLCVMCHNPGSTDYTTNNTIDLKNMLHKLHGGRDVLTKDYTVNGLAFRKTVTDATSGSTVYAGTAFPQEVRNCTKCHDNKAAANADNWMNVPSRNACGACHDGITFDGTATVGSSTGYTLADFGAGKQATSLGHVGGVKKDDTQCILCHDNTTIPVYHETTVSTTHNATPQSGVGSFAFSVNSVTVNSSKQPVISFQIKNNGAVVTLNKFATGGTVMITGFVSGPSLYVLYAVPQDGITAPADFNVSVSASLLNVWNGTAGTLAGPDANGYYTATLTTVPAVAAGAATSGSAPAVAAYPITIPTSAVMVTGAVIGGFTQTNLAAYPYDATTTSTKPGLATPGLASYLVATGYTARRAIVDNAKCNQCHEQLGTAPNFHGTTNVNGAQPGPRNDGTICAFCHTPNRTSQGWSARSSYFVHAIHAGTGTKGNVTTGRTVPFTWQASNGTENFSTTGYPGVLKNCETCHRAGTYDFSTTSSANIPFTTVATGIFNTVSGSTLAVSGYTYDNVDKKCIANGSLNSAGTKIGTAPTAQTLIGAYTLSPYLATATSYGAGFTFSANSAAISNYSCTSDGVAYNLAAQTSRAADANTLVISPIATACVACHDGKMISDPSQKVTDHIKGMGTGAFYDARSATTLAKSEGCLLCHGATSTIAPIKAMHNKNTPW